MEQKPQSEPYKIPVGGIINDDPQIDPRRLLALNIITFALYDYKNIMEKGKAINTARDHPGRWNAAEIEDFFRSQWAQELVMHQYSTEEMLSALNEMRVKAGKPAFI